jgi:hypothetical protein
MKAVSFARSICIFSCSDDAFGWNKHHHALLVLPRTNVEKCTTQQGEKNINANCIQFLALQNIRALEKCQGILEYHYKIELNSILES